MFKRELKCNFKNFMIWTIIILVLFGVVFAIYPSIASSDNIKSIDELAQIFPPEILSAFNMDIASLSTMFGWLKSEGFVMILLINLIILMLKDMKRKVLEIFYKRY